MDFPTLFEDIIKKIDIINPLQYGKTRNFSNGAVTQLSPYISRGVISPKQILQRIISKQSTSDQDKKLIQQLAWREYYQRVWQFLQDDIFEDIFKRYTGIQTRKIPTSIIDARTGILSIDNAINELYTSGYMHNHLRMYIASITCNIGKSNWQLPAQWMYYNLLDGDLASNCCSWQWITGNFSGKQYFCNQENINKYTGSQQRNTFLDKNYIELHRSKIPEILKPVSLPVLKTMLPDKISPLVDTSLPLVIYTSYNLDPLWRQDINANRILLLEPSHFKQFPVSEKVLNFILELSKNINGLQVFSGELNQLPDLPYFPKIYSKEHPLTTHFPGVKDQRDWIFPEIQGFFPSFFSYWNKCRKSYYLTPDKNYELAVA